MSEDRQYPPTIKWQSGIIEPTKGQDKKGRPITLIPDGHPVRMFFPYGDAREFTNTWGSSWMYAVEMEGVPHTLFANRKLHDALSQGGVGPTITLEITRTMEPMTNRDGTPWVDDTGRQRTQAIFSVDRIYSETGQASEDAAVEALGGDVIGGGW